MMKNSHISASLRVLRWSRQHGWSLLLYACVFVLSIIPLADIQPPMSLNLMDKWVHMLMYFGISSAVWLDICRRRGAGPRRWADWWWALAVPLLFGGAMELWQAWLTTCRSGDWVDWLADAIGCALAAPVGAWLLPALWRKSHRKG